MSCGEASQPLLVQAALSHLELALVSVHEQVEVLKRTSLREWAYDELELEASTGPTLPPDYGAADLFNHGVVAPPCDLAVGQPPLSVNMVSMEMNLDDALGTPCALAVEQATTGNDVVQPSYSIVKLQSDAMQPSASAASRLKLPGAESKDGAAIASSSSGKVEEKLDMRPGRTGTNQFMHATQSAQMRKLSHCDEPAPEPKGEVSRLTMLLFDIIPAVVISLNAMEIGLSQDVHAGDEFWNVCEYIWICCYTTEFAAKHYVFGIRGFWTGPERYWNWFDSACLFISFLEMLMTFILMSSYSSSGGSAMGILKMLRLTRLARIVRALQYPIFLELKQMVLGVIAGMRVLLWAIVLLGVCIFFLAVGLRTLMGENEEEFRTVPNAMLTTFRCYTDGCTAYNGTPLPERLFETYGGVFMGIYILSFIFITVGVFNLIMALLIDSVVSNRQNRALEDLGAARATVKVRIWETIEELINHDIEPGEEKLSLTDEDTKDAIVISRDKFHEWLQMPNMISCLKESGIELSTRSELFDVLDVDVGGELGVDELTGGLMRLRGPITKTDVVATRLQVRYLTGMVEEMYQDMLQVRYQNRHAAQHAGQSEAPGMQPTASC